MAQRARLETSKHFGNTVYLFTPLYIANYCENYCVYCGFNCYNHINRMKLSMEQIEKEMKVIADSGMEEILILTGESRGQSNVEYIGEACKLARKYFRMVGLEIYPVNTDEYKYLHECGADYVTVFQETYDADLCQVLCAYRIFLPYVGITVSSRESAEFRNGIVKIAATKVSAGVSTGIGDHESKYTGKETDEVQGDEQFEIDDNRSLDKMYRDIAEEGLQPVLNDYLYV